MACIAFQRRVQIRNQGILVLKADGQAHDGLRGDGEDALRLLLRGVVGCQAVHAAPARADAEVLECIEEAMEGRFGSWREND